MRIIIFSLIPFLILISCGEKVIEEPENLISEEEMTSILYDLAILNSTKGTNPSFLKKNNIELMPFIFKKYKIDSLQFAQSDLYYASIPLKYQGIYETVEERLTKKVEALEKEKKRRADSTKEVSKLRRDSLKTTIKLPVKDSLLKK
jgi:hypothetical protein